MGAKFDRDKPRNWLLSFAYKAVKFLPVSGGRKLDLLLDLEWITWRLAWEQGVKLGLQRPRRNDFLLDAITPTDRVLDLGSGTGSITTVISEITQHVVGIDHDQDHLAIARKAYPDIEFINADARDFLAAGRKFEVLIMSHVLEHLDQPAGILDFAAENFARIYIEVPDFENSQLNAMRLTRQRKLVYSDNDHVSEFDRAEIEALFRAAGLGITASEFRDGVMRYWVSPQKVLDQPHAD